MPPARNFSPWQQWMARLAATSHEDPFPGHDAAGIAAWRRRRRRCFLELLGPVPDRVPLAPETLETVHCDGYERRKVVFDSEDTMSVPAYLLVPDDRTEPGPAVLAIHGHGPGKSHVCGLADTAAAQRGLCAPARAPGLRCAGAGLALLR